MPIHTNTIGAFAFEDIRGRLQPKAQQLEVIVRPGHAGETTRKTGIRAVPFQVLTLHYVADWAAAKAALVAYVAAIDAGTPLEVVQHSLSYGYFKVLQVTEVEARACVQSIGTLIANAEVMQVVAWTLLSTDPP